MTNEHDVVIFDPHYPDELLPRNKMLCGIILDEKDKVVNTAIIERAALAHWFESKARSYDPRFHKFLFASVCIVGRVVDILKPADTSKGVTTGSPYKA